MVEIKQFKIENIEPWIKYESNNYLDKWFGKVNFIFWDNWVWKTTFVNILKYLWKENKIWQKFVNSNKDSNKDSNRDSNKDSNKDSNNYYKRLKSDKYQFYDSNLGNIKQTNFKEKIFVFDDVFVNDNIFVVSSNVKDSKFSKGRKDTIEIVLQWEIKGLYDKLNQKKENKKELTKNKKEKDNKINQLKEQLEKIKKQINENNNLELLKEWQKIEDLIQEKEKISQDLQEVNKNIEYCWNKVSKINDIERKIIKLEELKKRIQKNNEQKSEIEEKLKEMKDLEKFYQRYGKKITDFLNLWFDLWRKDTNICPFCQNKITKEKKKELNILYDKLKENITNLLEKKDKLNKDYNIKIAEKESLEKEIEDNKNLLKKKEEIEKNINKIKEEKNELIKKQWEIEKNIENFEKYKKFEESKKWKLKEKENLKKQLKNLIKEEIDNKVEIKWVTEEIKKIEEQIKREEENFTESFENGINSYLDNLWFSNFKLKLTRTKTLFKIEIIRWKTKWWEVISLSEWEKRALWLSFFLVLLENVDEDTLKESIVIFDDPITSLDGKRRKATEELLNNLFWQESPKFKVKQTFTFTHDKTFFKYLSKTIIWLKKWNKFTWIIYKTWNESESWSFLVSYDFKKTYDSFLEKLWNINNWKINNWKIEWNENYFSLIIEWLHKLRFCIEYFIREEVFEYDNFEKVWPFIERIWKISKKIKLEQDDIDNLSNLYSFCNKTWLHYEADDIQPTFNELKSKIKLFLEIKEKINWDKEIKKKKLKIVKDDNFLDNSSVWEINFTVNTVKI